METTAPQRAYTALYEYGNIKLKRLCINTQDTIIRSTVQIAIFLLVKSLIIRYVQKEIIVEFRKPIK